MQIRLDLSLTDDNAAQVVRAIKAYYNIGEVQEAVKPKTEKPKTEKPKTEKPKTEKPKTEKPKTEKPKTEKPKTKYNASDIRGVALKVMELDKQNELAKVFENHGAEKLSAIAPKDYDSVFEALTKLLEE